MQHDSIDACHQISKSKYQVKSICSLTSSRKDWIRLAFHPLVRNQLALSQPIVTHSTNCDIALAFADCGTAISNKSDFLACCPLIATLPYVASNAIALVWVMSLFLPSEATNSGFR